MNDKQAIVLDASAPNIKTNELKKGDWVVLANGWIAEVWDNKKGDTRVCDVYGFEHEAGSVYSHDIVAKIGVLRDMGRIDLRPMYTETYAIIEHTPAQLKLKKLVTDEAYPSRYSSKDGYGD